MNRRPILAVGGAAASLLLVGGCGGGSSAFCDAVTDDMASSAVVFNPVVPGGGADTGTASVENRIAFMDGVEEPPEGLEEEWTTFRDYLDEVQGAGETPVVQPDEVDEAREALFDAQMECRE